MGKPVNKLGPIRTAPKYSDFKTDGAIARALLANFPDTLWTVTERSLAAKIGNLDKGTQVWWINHPDNARCLAELLELSLPDLGLHESAIANHKFSFDDFPELPPLDLKRDKTWILAGEQRDSNQKDPERNNRETLEDWLAPALWIQRPPYSTDWLYVADDLERQLLSKKLAAKGNFDVLFVETLADVGARLLLQKSLIVSVRGDGGADDLVALARRPVNAGTLIIAPYMLPVRKQTSSAEFFGWEQLTLRGLEADSFRFTDPGRYAPLKRWTWTLFPDWRIRLLKWIDEYINRHGIDTLFSPPDMIKWLDQFDPREEWFCTATDMMHLCRMGHHNGKKLPAPTDAAAGNKLAISTFTKEPPSFSLKIKRLAEARWQHKELPWQGALPFEAWLSFTPQNTDLVRKDDLNAIAEGKNSSERKKIAEQILNRLEAGDPDALIASGLIRQERRGYFDFQHRTLASLAIRDNLIRQITEEPLASWALACFDDTRRPIVDAALDAVSILKMVDVAERLSHEAPYSAVAIGASEALFMAVARRIAQGEAISSTHVLALMRIAQSVLERLDLTIIDWDLPVPWTRPFESQDEQLEWITACWAWSLLPNVQLPTPANWLFPGWHDVLPEAPYWIENLWPDEDCEQLSSAWINFFSVVDQWMKDLERPIANAPRILTVSLLGKAARGMWKADSNWWQGLLNRQNREWAEDELLRRFKVGGANVAVRLWPSFLEFERNVSGNFIRYSHTRFWLLEQLNVTNTLNFLDDASRHYLASVPESLPPALRAPLLQSLPKESLNIDYSNALAFLIRFGPSAAPALADYLDHDILGEAAVTCLWDWDPENAIHILRHQKEFSTTALCRLILSCPFNHITVAVELLLAEPTMLDASERLFWVRKHLINSGNNAEHLLKIISTLSPNNL